MRVKRYVADSIQEAIVRVKNDLGRNAIILHTKPFKEGGFLGLFSRRRVEVIAAVDDDPKPAKISSETERVNTSGPVEPEVHHHTTATNDSAAPAGVTEADLSSLRDEIAEMKELIRQASFKPLVPSLETVSASPLVERKKSLHEHLTDMGLAEELVSFILSQIPESISDHTEEELLTFCRKVLEENLMFSEPMQMVSGQPSVVALVGPTGVGKTTTIAKLAAKFNLFERKKVGLITIDTYRIAAVEHLKTYGDIMNLPVEVVYTPSDLDRAIQNLSDCDLILIDTAGRSPHNQEMMDELHSFLTHSRIGEILLVISATTQLQDMMHLEEKFSKIAYTHLIFTKLDETSCLGPLVSMAWKSKRPISYVTCGQNVPDDIETAEPKKLMERLFEGRTHG